MNFSRKINLIILRGEMTMVRNKIGSQFEATYMTVDDILTHLFYYVVNSHLIDKIKFLLNTLLLYFQTLEKLSGDKPQARGNALSLHFGYKHSFSKINSDVR